MPNKLFNFLSMDEGKVVVNSFLPQFKKDRQSNAYFYLELAAIERQLGTYRLYHHHISVYAKTEQLELCEYHYTAHFIGDDQEKYKLHVYFNAKDEVICDPIFSKMESTPSDTVEYVSVPDYFDRFILLAKSACQKTIGDLRLRVKDFVRALDNKFLCLEKEACDLSEKIVRVADVDIMDNYISKLKELCQVLRQLDALVYNEKYKKILHVVTNIQKYFMREQERLLHLSDSTLVMPIDKPPTQEEVTPASSSSSQAHSLENLDSQIATWVTTFKALDKKHASYTNDLLCIEREISALWLLLDTENYVTSPEGRSQLQKLDAEVREAGADQLKYLLLTDTGDLLRSMEPFHYLLSINHVEYALLFGNARLLDFLLEFGHFNINTMPVVIKNVTYSSAVAYCVKTHSHESSKQIDCLVVLIKHGACLLELDDNGLPFAHIILSNPQNTLNRAFSCDEITQAKTIGSISFYRQLVDSVTNYINYNTEAVDEESIKGSLAQYKITIAQLNISNSHRFFMSKMGKGFKVEATKLASHCSENIGIQALKQDPIISQRLQVIEIKAANLFSQMSPVHKRQSVQQAQMFVRNFEKQLECGSDEVVTPKELTQKLGELEAHLDDRLSFFTISAELGRKGNFQGKKSKNRKKLEKELKELSKKIDGDIKKYVDLYSKGSLEDDQFLQHEIDDMILLMQHLEQLLKSTSILEAEAEASASNLNPKL